jgi:hypothetical protein
MRGKLSLITRQNQAAGQDDIRARVMEELRNHLRPEFLNRAATRLDTSIVWRYADLKLITPSPEGYGDDDLAELRRVRRLWQDLGFDHPTIEVILRLRRRILTL